MDTGAWGMLFYNARQVFMFLHLCIPGRWGLESLFSQEVCSSVVGALSCHKSYMIFIDVFTHV